MREKAEDEEDEAVSEYEGDEGGDGMLPSRSARTGSTGTASSVTPASISELVRRRAAMVRLTDKKFIPNTKACHLHQFVQITHIYKHDGRLRKFHTVVKGKSIVLTSGIYRV